MASCSEPVAARLYHSLFCLFGYPFSSPTSFCNCCLRLATTCAVVGFPFLGFLLLLVFPSENSYWFGSLPSHTARNAAVGLLGQVILCRYSQWFMIAASFYFLAWLILIGPWVIPRTASCWHESRSVSPIFLSWFGIIPVADWPVDLLMWGSVLPSSRVSPFSWELWKVHFGFFPPSCDPW